VLPTQSFQLLLLLFFLCPTVEYMGERLLARTLPKNDDIPKSPLPLTGSAGAIGRHDFKLEIDVRP
jgi:hypothetical protein